MMNTSINSQKYTGLLVRLVAYSLPFLYFYAVGDLVGALKQSSPSGVSATSFEQGLVQHNQASLVPHLVLIAILVLWGVNAYLLQLGFSKNTKTQPLLNSKSLF